MFSSLGRNAGENFHQCSAVDYRSQLAKMNAVDIFYEPFQHRVLAADSTVHGVTSITRSHVLLVTNKQKGKSV